MKKKMNKNLTVGLWLTGIMLTLILVGFFWTPYNPETMDNAAKLSGVSFSHLMGCDNFGRDIFSRVLKGGGTWNVIIALGIAFIPSFARIVRGEFIRCKNMDYVRSAKLAGAGNLRIMFVHILPNTVPVLLSAIMIGFNNAVLAEAGMSYLGIGVQPPQSSLGRMLSEAQTYLFSAPGFALFPGIFLIMLVLGFSLLGEGLKDREKE